MNILQLAKYYPPVYGGIELVEKMMTKSFKENGDNVFIVAFSNQSKQDVGEFGESVYRIEEKLNFLGAPISLDFFFSFKKFVVRNKINKIFVHLPNPYMHELVQLHRKFLIKHKICVYAVYHSDIVNKKIFGSLYDLLFRIHSNVYQKFIVSSNKLWESSPLLTKLNSDLKYVLPFCVEEDLEPRIVKRFNKRILAIGRMVPYKGYEFLIKSLNNTDYELNIIGEGPLLEPLKKIAASNIKFHMKVSDSRKSELFDLCDLLVVSSNSRAEAYGMTIVESFARGVPVLAANINSGVTFLVQNEVTGLVYEIEDQKDFFYKLKSIESRIEELSKNCRVFYEGNLTFNKFKQGIISL